jgi:hypothetical protein
MADCSCFRNCNCLSCLKIYETRCDPLKRLKRSNRDLHRLLRDLDYLCDSGPLLRKRIFIVEEKVSSEESCSCCSESCSSCEESDQTSDEDCDSFKCLKANDTSNLLKAFERKMKFYKFYIKKRRRRLCLYKD